jgi:hypothetical protein
MTMLMFRTMMMLIDNAIHNSNNSNNDLTSSINNNNNNDIHFDNDIHYEDTNCQSFADLCRTIGIRTPPKELNHAVNNDK